MVLLLCFAASHVQAADVYWSNNRNQNDWLNPGAGSNGSVFSNTDVVIFTGFNAASIVDPIITDKTGAPICQGFTIDNTYGSYDFLAGSKSHSLEVGSSGISISGGGTSNIGTTSAPVDIKFTSGLGSVPITNTGTELDFNGTVNPNGDTVNITGTGTTLFNGTTALTPVSGSTFTVNNTIVGGSGHMDGNVVVGNAAGTTPGTLTPGTSAATGTLSVDGNLTVNANSNLNFDLGTSSDKIAVAGSLTLPTSGTVNVNVAAGTGFGNGNFTLFTFTGTAPSLASLVLTNNPALVGKTGSISIVGSTVVLSVSNATPVTVSRFEAQPDGFGVLVDWKVASEFRNLGFNLYRRHALDPDDTWEKVNAQLIQGRLTKPTVKNYAWLDLPPEPGVFEYKLESISLLGERESFPSNGHALLAECDPTGAAGWEGAARLSKAGASALNARLERAFKQDVSDLLTLGSAPLGNGPEPRATRASERPLWDLVNDPNALNLETKALVAEPEPSIEARKNEKRNRVLLGGGFGFDFAPTNSGTASKDIRDTNDSKASKGSNDSNDASANGSNNSNANNPNSAALSDVNTLIADTLATAKKIAPPAYPIQGTALKATTNVRGLVKVPLVGSGFGKQTNAQRGGGWVKPVAESADGQIVFAPGYEDEYTNRDAFFFQRGRGGLDASITPASAKGLFGKSATNTAAASASTSYHDMYLNFLTTERYPLWISEQILFAGGLITFPLNLPNASTQPGTLSLDVYSYVDLSQPPGLALDHSLRVFVNGTLVSESVWVGQKFMTLTCNVPAGVLTPGENLIDLQAFADLGPDAAQVILVHGMKMDFSETLTGSGPLDVAANAGTLYEVNGLESNDVYVLDIREPNVPVRLPYEAQKNGASWTARFVAPANGSLWVEAAGHELAPEALNLRELQTPDHAGYLAVGPASFADTIAPLLTQRKKEGLNPRFVDQQDLIDAYGFGRYGPSGIHEAAKNLRPDYLLLLGRTNYDTKNFLGAGLDPLCPTFFVPSLYTQEHPGDALFGDWGKGYPECAIGRFPVENASDLAIAVQRTLSYKPKYGYALSNLMVTDYAAPDVGDFYTDADKIIADNPDQLWTKEYTGLTGDAAQIEKDLEKVMAADTVDVVVYLGHGSSALWGKYTPLLNSGMAANWTGNVVLLQGCCNGNYFLQDQLGNPLLAAQLMTQPQGGIAASISTGAYMDATPATWFFNQLLKNAGAKKNIRWGQALRATQQWAASHAATPGQSPIVTTWYTDLARTECLLGDPALPVR